MSYKIVGLSCARRLATEVRALRLEEAAANEEAEIMSSEIARMQESIDLYRATIARVESLCSEADEADDCRVDIEVLRGALRGAT